MNSRFSIVLVCMLVILLAPSVNALENLQIKITNNDDRVLPPGTLNITFDHADLVSKSRSLANGTDVRIFENGTEIDRFLCYGSHWNTEDTCVEFNLSSSVPSGNSNFDYVMEIDSVEKTPMNNATNVYMIYDDFDTVRHGWTNVSSGGNCESEVADGFLSANLTGSPSDCYMYSDTGAGTTNFKVESVVRTEQDNVLGHRMVMLGFGSSIAGWDHIANYTFIRKAPLKDSYGIFDIISGSGSADRAFVDGVNLGAFDNISFSVFNQDASLGVNTTTNTTTLDDNKTLDIFYIYNLQGTNPHNSNITVDEVRVKRFVPRARTTMFVGLDNCKVFDVLILNFTVYDEESRTNFVHTDFEATFTFEDTFGDIVNQTIIATNTTNLSVCTSVNTSLLLDATIKYENTTPSATDYSIRYFFMNNNSASNDTSDIFLYLLEKSLSTQIRAVIRDSFNIEQEEVIVKFTRFFISDGKYIQVEQGLTGFDGVYSHNLKVNEWYIIILEKDGKILRSYPQKFIIDDSDIELFTSTGRDVEYWEYYDSVGANCDVNEVTATITCTFSDTSGKMVNIDMLLEKRQLVGGFVDVCTNSTTASSGTISCSYAGHNNTEIKYSLTGSFCCSVETTFGILTGVLYAGVATNFGPTGIFILILTLMVGLLLGRWNPIVPIVSSVFVIALGSVMGLILVSSLALGSLIIAGVLLAYKMR